ncbi:rod shape-determining protein MreC [Bacillus sp. RAR_GA_16]|uniref:rod shape-determining protein MreC n=1 Tax=Bacillus sp. RAR_GA_16 TaxID=2876774 RepID=UPI001CCBCA81|nr:rod shape-determining protein MreC [Bacillus sp. RAR_GA_16]MCA0171698.1 rod shape-determining protein MreC [Bacillus sp. RAR_GA_16]
MPQFFSNKRLIVLLVSIIILVALIGTSMKERDALTMPEQFFKDSIGWLQSIFYKPANSVAGLFESIGDMKDMYEENELLKSRLNEFVAVSEELKTVKKENKDLKSELNIDSSTGLSNYQTFHANMIARSPDRWNDLLTIDKGEQDGVKADMAVATPDGLIGKVKNVQPFSSTVQLISDVDRTNRIAAMTQEDKNVFGTIEGYDTEKEVLLFSKIPVDTKVEKGQTVITAGNGGIFPRGIVIGEIVDIETDNVGTTQTAYVKPASDLYDINNVMIIDRGAQNVNPDEGEGEEE